MPNSVENSREATILAETLGPALLQLVRQFRAGIHAAGLSPSQAMVLKRLHEHPGLGVGELAAAERLRRPTISSHIKELEAAGLVERLPPHADDRRRVGFKITPAGRVLLETVKARWTEWLAHRLDELPAPGRRALADALPHLGAMSAHTEPTP
ncbi:MAG TPA: MarR family transcriptional regulator [Aliidongia sp.]|uniref:MarR family winged helix-turn-helix transcriptional regulator n=1 Tax=Aliidongia sp. TaxID=1914230 RepID=UPI002DDCA173|nr:MarR family transcriptional regulator [Aliidongia sp.]HEV2676226.1 MarR family transcriptional regulator [Aliidongia sp.]